VEKLAVKAVLKAAAKSQDHGAIAMPRLVVLALSFALAAATAAHAQPVAKPAAEPAAPAKPPAPDEVVDDAAADNMNPQMNVNVFEIQAQQFDMWVFGNQFNVVNVNGVNVAKAQGPRGKLDAMLALKVDEVEKFGGLSSAQRDKLLLAGRGDIRGFLEQVEVKRRKFEEVRKDQQRFGMFYQEIQPLRAAFQGGLFTDDSIFGKSLAHTLDSSQAAKFEEGRRVRAAYRYSAAVDLLTAKLGLALGLTAEQRVRFARIITDNTRAPKNLGTQEFNAVFYLASTVPVTKFKPLLDNAQIRVLERQFMNMRAWQQILKQQGFVPADEPAEKGPKK
jgi:hypothetical protein